MGDDAISETESGRELGRVDDHQMVLSHAVRYLDLAGTVCLRFLDSRATLVRGASQAHTSLWFVGD
jgi:hypothetical protein